MSDWSKRAADIMRRRCGLDVRLVRYVVTAAGHYNIIATHATGRDLTREEIRAVAMLLDRDGIKNGVVEPTSVRVASDPSTSEDDLLKAAEVLVDVVRQNPAAKLYALADPEAWAWIFSESP